MNHISTYFAVTNEQKILTLPVLKRECDGELTIIETILVNTQQSERLASEHKNNFQRFAINNEGVPELATIFMSFEKAMESAINQSLAKITKVELQLASLNNHVKEIHNTMKPILFSNEYGDVTLIPTMEYVSVKDISAEKCPQAAANMISITEAEQIALITENVDIQICFSLTGNQENNAYVVHHITAHTAAICAVTITSFDTLDYSTASEKINDLAFSIVE